MTADRTRTGVVTVAVDNQKGEPVLTVEQEYLLKKRSSTATAAGGGL